VGRSFAEWPKWWLFGFLVPYVALFARLWRPLPVRLSPTQRLMASAGGAVLSLLGMGLILWGRVTLGRMYNLSSALGNQLYADQELVTSGPFAWVRHPMYLGALIASVGGVLLYRTWAAVLVLAHEMVFWVRAGKEEQALAAEFGDAWRTYARRVPAGVPVFGGPLTITTATLARGSTRRGPPERHSPSGRSVAMLIGAAAVSVGVVAVGAGVGAVARRGDPVRLLFPLLTRRAARQALTGRSRSRLDPAVGRFTRADADRLVTQAWQHYDARVRDVPPQPTVGATLVLRLACWSAGLFDSLRDDGVEREQAVELAADVMWRIFQLQGRFGQVLTRIRPELKTQPRRRLPDGSIDLGFPFGPPAYGARPVAADGVRSFEVVRCPAASYFRARGLADLGQAAFCDMDYALSEMQGLSLQRACTLMAGDDHCDFLWPAPSQPTHIGHTS
jgi:protein-S-isoprenylcysteine O-methyltransferase Ste14